MIFFVSNQLLVTVYFVLVTSKTSFKINIVKKFLLPLDRNFFLCYHTDCIKNVSTVETVKIKKQNLERGGVV